MSTRASTTTTMVASDAASKRNSKRFSIMAPSIAESAHSASTMSTHGDSRIREIKELSLGFARLTSPKLQQQRYTPSAQKADDMNTLALGAKVERALGRRMTGQDAVMRPKPVVVQKAG